MKLRVLGSGSSGNCYILENDNEALILEAGIKFSEVKEALGFDFSKVSGLLITHEHCDHAPFMPFFMQYGINIYASKGTHQSFVGYGWNKRHCILDGETYDVGNFKIMPFETIHDAAEPLGFIIKHADFGTLLFCTDSKTLPYKFNDLDHILIEANYSFDLIEKSAIRNRVFENHMEIGTTIDFLKHQDLKNTKNIVLLHLSGSNSDRVKFKNDVEKLSEADVYIAEKGLNVKLSKEMF